MTTTPDPGENRPSQAEGASEKEGMESAVAPPDNGPTQAEGSPGNQDVDSPGGSEGNDPARGGAAD